MAGKHGMCTALIVLSLVTQVIGCAASGGPVAAEPTPATANAAANPETPPPVAGNADLVVETREEKWPSGIPKQKMQGYVDETGEFIWHGMVEKWYESGQPQFRGEFRDGLPQGEHTTWYLHGQMWGNGRYEDGLEHGKWRKWHQNGELYSEWSMERGAWNGIYTEWHDNGKKRIEVEFIKGLRQGPQYMWDEQGVLVQVADFVNSIEQP